MPTGTALRLEATSAQVRAKPRRNITASCSVVGAFRRPDFPARLTVGGGVNGSHRHCPPDARSLVVLALTVSVASLTSPGTAYAKHGNGAAIALGILGGALAGAAIGSGSAPGYYAAPPVYYYPYAPPVYSVAPAPVYSYAPPPPAYYAPVPYYYGPRFYDRDDD